MIAKSKWVALLLSLLISVAGRAEIKNLFEQIIDEYDIHPPNLKYGYPLWYQYDSLPVTGIIFLKTDLDDLYRMDKITYVAEPTKENADIIFNFSGDVKGYPKFYIVPDSNLTWKEVSEFMEYLTPQYRESQFLLCGSKGRYANYRLKDGSHSPDNFYCGYYRNVLVIMNNCRGEILCEGEFIESDSISVEVFEYYSDNYFSDENPRSLYRLQLTKEICLNQIIHLNMLKDRDTSLGHMYEDDILKYQKFLRILEMKNKLSLPFENTFIEAKFQNCDRSISQFYAYLDHINKGVYLSREKSVERWCNRAYERLFIRKKYKDLEYVHFEFPDMLEHEFYSNERLYPPPPRIEEVVIIHDLERIKLLSDTTKVTDTLIVD